MRQYKNIAVSVRYLLIFVFVFSLLSGGVYAEETVSVTTDTELPVQYKQDMLQFVRDIYDSYAGQDFPYVYQTIHPVIRRGFSEKKYVDFQQINFNKYELKISEIEVISARKLEEMPDDLVSFLSVEDVKLAAAVSVKYLASFKKMGMHFEREINKDVYVCLDEIEGESHLFLLWDPEVLEEEEED